MIKNQVLHDHPFLKGMYDDGWFPDACVDKAVAVLRNLCEQIEASEPRDLAALYELTHAATEDINDLEEEFEANDSEIETVARKVLADEFALIADAYGFTDADREDLIAPRNW